MAEMMLGGQPLYASAHDVRWSFKLKSRDYKTLGGKVIQIIGVTLGDITIQGAHSPRRGLGEREAWQSEMRFRERIRTLADRAVNTDNTDPIRFFYAPRNWDFQVYVKSINVLDWKVETWTPKWQLVLFPMDEQSTEVVKGIKDLYIKRLMDGVGWKQSDYNGPTQFEVDEKLNGLSVEEYVATGLGEAYEAGTQGRPYEAGLGAVQ